MKRTTFCPKNALLFAMLAVGATLAASPMAAHGRATYQPGVLIVPEVLRPDGATDEMYSTGQGMSLWTPDRSIPLGDQVKLNVFVATGGAELKEVKIRIDSSLIADVTKAPWRTTLDTAKLGQGRHMVEVWALPTGNNPPSLTQTLFFNVAPAVKVEGIQQKQGPNGQVIETPLPTASPATEPDTFSDALPQLPDYLKSQTINPDATVTIMARSAASTEQAGGTVVSDTPITVDEPTLFIVQPAPGSAATRFAYAIVRSNGATVSASPEVLRTAYDRIRIERRTDTQAGLRPGKVTLWIWGVDKQGNYSNPVKTNLDIPPDK